MKGWPSKAAPLKSPRLSTHLQEAGRRDQVIPGQQQIVHEHPEEGPLCARRGLCILQHAMELEQVPAWGGGALCGRGWGHCGRGLEL